jgi:hypothetical protein
LRDLSVIFHYIGAFLGGKECPGVFHLTYSSFPDPQYRYLDLKSAILNFSLIRYKQTDNTVLI